MDEAEAIDEMEAFLKEQDHKELLRFLTAAASTTARAR